MLYPHLSPRIRGTSVRIVALEFSTSLRYGESVEQRKFWVASVYFKNRALVKCVYLVHEMTNKKCSTKIPLLIQNQNKYMTSDLGNSDFLKEIWEFQNFLAKIRGIQDFLEKNGEFRTFLEKKLGNLGAFQIIWEFQNFLAKIWGIWNFYKKLGNLGLFS